MFRKVAIVAGLGLVLGAGVMGSSALAKCTKECKQAISSEFKACKTACGKDKVCKKACTDDKKDSSAACKVATNPTPPFCGDDDSPSAAFLE